MKLRKCKYKSVVKAAVKFEPWDYGFILDMERAALEKQQKRDQLIQEYCDNNNIKIIWIKYDIPKSEVLNILKQNLL